jgi:hypothetical protein
MMSQVEWFQCVLNMHLYLPHFWQRIRIVISTTIPLNQRISCGRLKISYTEYGLFTKSKFIECGENDTLFTLGFEWDHKTYSLNMGFH